MIVLAASVIVELLTNGAMAGHQRGLGPYPMVKWRCRRLADHLAPSQTVAPAL
jgi:hypothetical protein